MSRYTIEKVLWDLIGHPQVADRFRADTETFLDAYPLEPPERALLKNMDVRAIVALRINPMLLMRAWQAVFGRDQRPKYLQQLGASRAVDGK